MRLTSHKKKLLEKDPTLASLFAQVTLSSLNPSNEEPYSALISAIAHQMVHGKAAEACLKRLANHTGAQYDPQKIVQGGIPLVRSCGFSNNKSLAIFELAEKNLRGELCARPGHEQKTNAEIIRELIPLRGVGKWTVEMYLIFGLGRLDVFPVDDFGVREGYRLWKKKRAQEKPAVLAKKARKWAPYGTVVSLALWKLADLHKKVK